MHRDADSVGNDSISYHKNNNSRKNTNTSRRVHQKEFSDDESASVNSGTRRNRRGARNDASTVGDDQTEDVSLNRPTTPETNVTEQTGRSLATYDEPGGGGNIGNDRKPRRRNKYDDMGSYAGDSFAGDSFAGGSYAQPPPPPRNSKRSAPRIPKGENNRGAPYEQNHSRRMSRERRDFDEGSDTGTIGNKVDKEEVTINPLNQLGIRLVENLREEIILGMTDPIMIGGEVIVKVFNLEQDLDQEAEENISINSNHIHGHNLVEGLSSQGRDLAREVEKNEQERFQWREEIDLGPDLIHVGRQEGPGQNLEPDQDREGPDYLGDDLAH
eukprot:CAMPEP_0203711692 /NCGR_PEP_ID=MMETSP0091-20130426/69648_1 /ASSEMBLY_ACC=CAM_ASM_001089 /TAXON_ID=426623 /ORGANISM="Chaetoceros affinis, Strain CCMP159" /LENGTH=327 /DNA_ID=CAMNT_0050589637 /DNA_START=27 /DNA_END=1011 /DNA_ORIENTATION=+